MSDNKHPNLASALAAFQAEMPTVAKTKRANVGQYSYTYADLADVTESAAPILAKHGLAFAGSARHVEGGRYEVVGILSHESGEEREGALPIVGNGPQQLGSAITYMRRYLYGVMTGIVTDNDDDGALASAQQEQKRERRRATTTDPRQNPPEEPPRGSSSPAPPQAGSIAARTAATGPASAGVGGAMQAKTRGRLFALFGDLDITDEDEQRRGISSIVGREVASRASLTEDEAKQVIRVLEQKKRHGVSA